MSAKSQIVVRRNHDGVTWDIGLENDDSGFDPMVCGYATEAAAVAAIPNLFGEEDPEDSMLDLPLFQVCGAARE